MQGVLRDGNDDILVNISPHSSTIPITQDGKAKLYYCMALSVCMPSTDMPVENDYVINYKNRVINSVSFLSRVGFSILGENLYLYDVVDNIVSIVMRNRVRRAKILNTTLKNIEIDIEDKNTFSGVYGVSIIDEKGVALSIASSEPIVIELNNQKIEASIPRAQLMIISSKTHTKVFRDIIIYNSIGVVKGFYRTTQALIEILDPITLGFVEGLDNGCVDLLIINPENIDLNSIVKVYGYIDEILIDDTTKFKPRHNLLRIAMAALSKSKIRMCISTSMPMRSDMFLKLKSFVQASSQL